MQLDNMRELLSKQKKFFNRGDTLSVKFRANALKCFLNIIEKYEERVIDALREDLGKSRYESYMCEVALVKSELGYMLRHIKRFSSIKRVHTPLAQFASKSYVKPVPYGSVLIMSPWNYPFLLTCDPLIDAIAAGNTAIVKPSAYSPATSAVIAQMLYECFPAEYVAAVTGGRQENTSLLQCDFDYIFFTGSKTVGREVMRAASEQTKKRRGNQIDTICPYHSDSHGAWQPDRFRSSPLARIEFYGFYFIVVLYFLRRCLRK